MDETRLPETSDELRERSAELRPAWAATEWPPAADLLRAQRSRASRLMLTRAAAIAVLVAGIGVVAWAMDRQPRQASTSSSRSSQAQPPRAVSTGGQAPAGALSPPPPLLPLTSISEEQRPQPPRAVTPAPIVVAPRPQPQLPRQPVAPSAPPRTVAVPPVEARTAPAPPTPPRAVEKPVTPAPATSPARVVREPPPTPFDASLETILYSADRRLALIDGRIVQVGDVVRGATIVDITPTTVLLRDSAGRPRSLALDGRR